MSNIYSAQHSDGTSYRPLPRIPERRSSRIFHTRTDSDSSAFTSNPTKNGAQFAQTLKPPEAVTARGKSTSPIKRPSTSEDSTRTLVPTVLPTDILELPKLTHPRLQLHVRLFAPLFIGGATIEGEIRLAIDSVRSDSKRHSLQPLKIHRISASVIGVEQCKGKQEIFQALTKHILHVNELPIISDATKSFRLDLPLAIGPPPYRTKKAGIRYLLSILVEFRIEEETRFVRQTREVDILTVFDRTCLIFTLHLHIKY